MVSDLWCTAGVVQLESYISYMNVMVEHLPCRLFTYIGKIIALLGI